MAGELDALVFIVIIVSAQLMLHYVLITQRVLDWFWKDPVKKSYQWSKYHFRVLGYNYRHSTHTGPVVKRMPYLMRLLATYKISCLVSLNPVWPVWWLSLELLYMHQTVHTHWYADDSLAGVQHEFMEKHYQEFEDGEENKFIYTDIFKQYVSGRCTCL